MIEQARKLYEQAQANYPALKAQIESQVVRWFWASGGMGLFSLEPFYFEEHNFAKSKILKEIPEDSDNKHQYGVNEKEDIIVVRNYPKLRGIIKGQYWEKFYFREENQIISYYFDHSAKKECANVKIFIYKDGLLQHIYAAFKEHYWEETMYYEGDKLIRRETKGVDNCSDPINDILLYTYDMSGELNSITSGTSYVIYQKKGKKV